jgi:hypothetical protein
MFVHVGLPLDAPKGERAGDVEALEISRRWSFSALAEKGAEARRTAG